MKYRAGDKVMSKRIARCERRIIQDIARPKKRQFHIGKLWTYYDASRPHPVKIEGLYHPEYECVIIPAQIRFVYWGNSILVKVIRLKGKRKMLMILDKRHDRTIRIIVVILMFIAAFMIGF